MIFDITFNLHQPYLCDVIWSRNRIVHLVYDEKLNIIKQIVYQIQQQIQPSSNESKLIILSQLRNFPPIS